MKNIKIYICLFIRKISLDLLAKTFFLSGSRTKKNGI